MEQLKALYSAKNNECDQLKNKLMAGLPPVGSSSGSPSSSQTALLEGKLKAMETKVASEIRQREMVEKRLEATKTELEDMKKRREAARSRVQTKASADVTAAKARTALASQDAARGRGAPRASVRQSVRAGPGAPAKVNVGDLVTKILAEMQRVEAAIKKAEEDRQTAENELLEVACFKQAAEDRFTELSDLVAQVSVLVNNLQILIATKCGGAPDVKAALVDFHGKIDSLVTRAAAIAKGAAATSNAEVTRIAVAVGAPPPPPPPGLVLAAAPSAPGPRASTILTQIRKGTTLKQLDAGAIKREREEKAKNHRQSVSILNSLQDTLRSALANRQGAMNPDSAADDDDWAGDY